ncbi:alpha-glucosidase [Spiroplasma tabanidicola]|uniref:Glycosyl hydrolase family 13 catalytic domain-containing protein n=1 Tax=Spiroplasma tabanidicola TaxID=324079 RepID=A0A6I6C6M8_9MOLU|nr:alpha-glucosidase [Spiroplasma tabanidicola]QGS51840.1 hypothetical protein STABA_v1c04770 [Spiroplasma tabanidicola]
MKNYVWWKTSNMYQIWPKSFKDTNNDGIGDLKGVTQKLDYIKDLGFDAIWLSPFFKSPMADNGYDVADYYHVNPIFGTDEDFDELIKEAKKRDIKLIIDMVFNHTSDQHEWFIDACKSKDSIYSDYYIWRDKPDDSITSMFTGPAWTYCEARNQYYLHLFDKTQPDLNWDNPKVLEECAKVLDYWHNKKGIAGFRFDVLELLGKDIENHILANGPKLHSRINELMKKGNLTYETVKIGECWGAGLEETLLYTDKKNEELSMVFNFKTIKAIKNEEDSRNKIGKLNVEKLKNAIVDFANQVVQSQGWLSTVLENHDLPRSISVFGDSDYWQDSAKTLALLLYSVVGTPFVYQGQEIGTKNFVGNRYEDFNDIELFRMKVNLVDSKKMSDKEFFDLMNWKGRDNARRPIQWNSEKNFGFTNGTPWITMNNNQNDITVENQLKDPNSILNFYKKLNQLRKGEYLDYFVNGNMKLNQSDNEIIDFSIELDEKPSLRFIGNFGKNQNKHIINKYSKIFFNEQNIDIKESEIILKPWSSILILE